MTAYDPFDPVVAIDPYPAYGWLRDEAPLHHSAVTDTYVLSRYDDFDALVPWLAADQELAGAGAEEHIDSSQFRGRRRLELVRKEAW